MSSFKKADILIPQNIDFEKWSVVACDQYTSQPEYWQSVYDIVGDSYSTLNIIFPEVYLSEGDGRIEKINSKMNEYINSGIFKEYKNSLIYVERTISNGKIRHGIVGAIDLEDYDFSKGSTSNVRATEGTVLERIPPRVKIRENAPLELPHIMILIDDEKKEIVEGITTKEKIYDFHLMKDSGHICGYLVDDASADRLLSKLEKTSSDSMTFAVGDGNHSLATAKTCWENIKKTLTPEQIKVHPARYALCEIVNLHDDALEFEPIHRVVFNTNPAHLISELENYYQTSETDDVTKECQFFEYITKTERKKIYIKNPPCNLAVGTLQKFLDDYIQKFGGTVDYIHGEDVTSRLALQDGNIGFILPPMPKNELFKTVIADGALPRKTFSMGEAEDKRFYLECKKIK